MFRYVRDAFPIVGLHTRCIGSVKKSGLLGGFTIMRSKKAFFCTENHDEIQELTGL